MILALIVGTYIVYEHYGICYTILCNISCDIPIWHFLEIITMKICGISYKKWWLLLKNFLFSSNMNEEIATI